MKIKLLKTYKYNETRTWNEGTTRNVYRPLAEKLISEGMAEEVKPEKKGLFAKKSKPQTKIENGSK